MRLHASFPSTGWEPHWLEWGLSSERGACAIADLSTPSPVAPTAIIGRQLAGALMRLGPTFIKLGQILATRPDLVGEQISDELTVLFDRVKPCRFSKIRRILMEELGQEQFKEQFHSTEMNTSYLFCWANFRSSPLLIPLQPFSRTVSIWCGDRNFRRSFGRHSSSRICIRQPTTKDVS